MVGFIIVGLGSAIRGCGSTGSADLSGGEVGVLVGLVVAVAFVTIGVLALLIRLFRGRR